VQIAREHERRPVGDFLAEWANFSASRAGAPFAPMATIGCRSTTNEANGRGARVCVHIVEELDAAVTQHERALRPLPRIREPVLEQLARVLARPERAREVMMNSANWSSSNAIRSSSSGSVIGGQSRTASDSTWCAAVSGSWTSELHV